MIMWWLLVEWARVDRPGRFDLCGGLSQTSVCDRPRVRGRRVPEGEPGGHVEFELAVHGDVAPDRGVSPR